MTDYARITWGSVPLVPICPRCGEGSDRASVMRRGPLIDVEPLLCSKCLGAWDTKPPLLVPGKP